MAKKILFILFIFLLIFLGSFLGLKKVLALHTCADPPLTTFSDGSTVKTVIIPAGGGTLEAARIKLPMGSTICEAEIEIDRAVTPTPDVGTPFIWIPASTQNKLIQLRTSDGSLVRVFGNGSNNCNGGPSFTNPSRITVIPDGDIWVANRGNGTVTRLGRIVGCIGDDCYECKGTYSTCGGDNRGITFDSDLNIWAGSWGSNCLVRLCGYSGCQDVNGGGGYAIGERMEINAAGSKQINGFPIYGLIGDSYGYVWSASGGNVYRVNINDNTGTASPTGVGSIYGIGIDNEGDIWIGRHGATGIWEIDGADPGGAGTGVMQTQCPTAFTNTGLAVDGNNNVWSTGYSGNAVYVVKGGNCGQIFYRTGVCTWNQPHGMAIDADNHAWLICDTGEAIKYAFHDDGDAVTVNDGNDDIEELQRINLCALPGVGCGNESGATYNYSDMTGFRTSTITFDIPGYSVGIPTYPYTLSGSGFSNALTSTFGTCSGGTILAEDICGNYYCEVPITVSSVFLGGTYTLSNLKIHWQEPPSKMTGGLVPCGRTCDDMSTALREDEPCTLCHLFVLIKRVIDFLFLSLVIPVAILLLVIGGVMFLFSAENPQRIEQGKTILKTVIIGFVIFFAAWLIANVAIFFITEARPPLPSEIAKIFGKSWHEIPCPEAPGGTVGGKWVTVPLNWNNTINALCAPLSPKKGLRCDGTIEDMDSVYGAFLVNHCSEPVDPTKVHWEAIYCE